MPGTDSNQDTPLTFELAQDIYEALEELKSQGDYKSVSQIIRKAIETFDFSSVEGCGTAKRQRSARIPKELREQLQAVSKDAGVSIGNLIRRCLVDFLKTHPDSPETPPQAAPPKAHPAASGIELTLYKGKRLVHFKQGKEPFALDEDQIAAVLNARNELESLLRKRPAPEASATPAQPRENQSNGSSRKQASDGSSDHPPRDLWDLKI